MYYNEGYILYVAQWNFAVQFDSRRHLMEQRVFVPPIDSQSNTN